MKGPSHQHPICLRTPTGQTECTCQGCKTLADLQVPGQVTCEQQEKQQTVQRRNLVEEAVLFLVCGAPRLSENATRRGRSEAVKDLIRLCVSSDPKARPTVSQLKRGRIFETPVHWRPGVELATPINFEELLSLASARENRAEP